MRWGLEGVSVDFGSVEALNDVDLTVERGQIVVVVGGDGAGKTTLCRTLVGLQSSVAGEVTRPSRVGFQPASSGTWRDLTVLENLNLVSGAYSLDPEHARVRVAELLEVTRLDSATDRLAGRLSGGMRQKLGVAMAVLSEPDLLILDEPTTGVDPVSRLELWSFITRSAREGRGVVVTTTYVDESEKGDSVLALESGRVLASGSVSEVVASMPGAMFASDRRSGTDSWRRGNAWRVWSRDGSNPGGLVSAEPDMADVVTVAALQEGTPDG